MSRQHLDAWTTVDDGLAPSQKEHMAGDEEAEVLAANAAFYDAFLRKDAESMDRLWAQKLPVLCIHPGWTILRGRARVMASWRGILSGSGAPSITCLEPTAYLFGETAIVVCYEALPGARLVATNLFAREDGSWKMVHHQASPLALAADSDDDEDGSGGTAKGPSSLN